MTPPATARAAAEDLLARGYAPVPIPPRLKGPRLPEWEQLRLTPELLDAHFPAGRDMNVGVLLGEPSGGLVDVDLDSSEARAAAPLLLPDTGMISGRASAPRSHYWYVVDAPPRKSAEDYDDPSDGDDVRRHLLEFRSTGGQTVLPPSVYPAEPRKNKPREERCVWHRPGPAARVPVADLLPAVRRTAAAALLGRHWTEARNKRAMALSGGLLRAGWTVGQAEAFVRAVAAAAGDEEPDNRADTVAHTAKALTAGKNVTGWPKLAALLGAAGDAVVKAVVGWLGVQFGPKVTAGQDAAAGATTTAGTLPTVPIPEYVPFPTDLLPPAVRAYVEATAGAMNCDAAYSALPVLAALGAAIGSSHVVGPKKGWKEPPYIWALPIGKSGAVKSPPYRDVEDMAEDINDRLEREYKADAAAFEDGQADWAEKRKLFKDGAGPDPGPRPKPPVEKSFVKGDVTIEALVGTLQDNPRGLFIGQDELSAWIGGFVKYAGKTGSSDLPRWLQLSNAGSINYTRKTGDRRKIRIRGVGVSVAGTIQPKILSRVLTEEFRASGFLARLLLAMPPWRKRQWTEAEVDDATRGEFQALLNALYEVPAGAWPDGRPAPHLVRLADDAKVLFVAFYNANGTALETADEDMSAVMSKLEGYALRFALIFHCCRLKDYAGRARITGDDMAAAIKLTMWFRDEAERVYMALGEDADTQSLRHLYEVVSRLADRRLARRGPPRGITARDLQNHNTRKYPSHDHAAAALETLVAARLGEWVDGPEPSRGGHRLRFLVPRPTSDTSYTRPEDDEDTDSGGDDDPSYPRPDGSGGDSAGVGPEPRTGEEVATENTPETESSVGSVGRRSGAGAGDSDPVTAAPSGGSVPESVGPSVGGGGVRQTTNYTLITDPAGLPLVRAALEDTGGPVGLDTETTGLNPAADRARLLQLATERDTFVIDLFGVADPADLAPLFEHLAGREVVGHNLQFDLRFLARLGFVPGPVFDTLLASQVLHAGERTATFGRLRHGLKDVLARELGREVSKAEQASDWAGTLTDAQLGYAAADAAVLLPLAETLKAKLAGANLTAAAGIEMRALPCVAWAADTGVGFDRPAWEALTAEAEARAAELREQLDALAPNGASLFGTRNWNSPDQVAAAFAALGVAMDSTDDDALSGVDHPLAALVREYRGVAKRAGTYGREWLRHAAGGRVYAAWKQVGAEMTGRMSCAAPNLQQLPRDPRYRACFVAPPGCVLVKADYSQIELRVAAKVSGDARMLEVYRQDRDIHALTAAMVLEKPEAEVTRADRQLAKAVNFGLLYGQGAAGLRVYARSNFGVTITLAEAEAYRRRFFAAYPGLRRWHRSIRDGAVDTRTLTGRRRVGVEAYTQKLNTPVQGTGGDGLKLALALLWERRAECPHAAPVLVVHDEIVVEVREESAEDAAAWLTGCMVDAMADLLAPVPVAVDSKAGPTWGG